MAQKAQTTNFRRVEIDPERRSVVLVNRGHVSLDLVFAQAMTTGAAGPTPEAWDVFVLHPGEAVTLDYNGAERRLPAWCRVEPGHGRKYGLLDVVTSYALPSAPVLIPLSDGIF